jgi:hypothetical protein
MAALLKSAESKDFVGSNPTLSATRADPISARCVPTLGRSTAQDRDHRLVLIALSGLHTRLIVVTEVQQSWVGSVAGSERAASPRSLR